MDRLSDGMEGGHLCGSVLARMGSDHPRLETVMARLVEDLHRIVCDLSITRDELQTAIRFLTDVGQSCDDQRQEWVLMADALGLSMLVTDLEGSANGQATPMSVGGRFYRADAPERRSGDSISIDGQGDPLHVSLSVAGQDGMPVAGARVETWQANAAGLYENQDPDLQPEHNLRGMFLTDSNGRVEYTTVIPGRSRLPQDGPTGQLMARLGMSMLRPAHLNFRISAEGHRVLMTQIFDRDDPAIGQDALFGVKPELLARFEAGTGSAPARVAFDFKLPPMSGGKTRNGKGRAT